LVTIRSCAQTRIVGLMEPRFRRSVPRALTERRRRLLLTPLTFGNALSLHHQRPQPQPQTQSHPQQCHPLFRLQANEERKVKRERKVRRERRANPRKASSKLRARNLRPRTLNKIRRLKPRNLRRTSVLIDKRKIVKKKEKKRRSYSRNLHFHFSTTNLHFHISNIFQSTHPSPFKQINTSPTSNQLLWELRVSVTCLWLLRQPFLLSCSTEYELKRSFIPSPNVIWNKPP